MKKLLCTLSALVLCSIAVNAQNAISNNRRQQQMERLKKVQEEKRLRRLHILNRKLRTTHLPEKKEQQLNNAPIKDSTTNKN